MRGILSHAPYTGGQTRLRARADRKVSSGSAETSDFGVQKRPKSEPEILVLPTPGLVFLRDRCVSRSREARSAAMDLVAQDAAGNQSEGKNGKSNGKDKR